MRVRITFNSLQKSIPLPWHYPAQLQGLLFRWLRANDRKLARLLHDVGFVYQGHSYKLIVFSHLRGTFAKAATDSVFLDPPLRWWISSPLDPIVQSLVGGLFGRPYVRLGQQTLIIERVQVEDLPDFSHPTTFYTLSPVVVSTCQDGPDGPQKIFLSPDQPDFVRVIRDNLQRKASLLGINAPANSLAIQPGRLRSRLFQLHGGSIRGWEGEFLLSGPPELIRVAYEAGLGERNAQGFGMLACRQKAF
ncbi:CRISPR repeat RNA endoribonuclease Cas6 [Thermogutta terrifontis]|jgi:CRISPR-associated endoribonuclease Cas6|uniref:CRISPR-associated endoribonuclease n=1 Tax=Thermogutta terrifontis TaxID=1331910 RepID=A0A286RLT7_9BACT|nr:CRISPR-associated endoribonuclease Cas6 [Thermogutta terrifontis]ASV76922.1 CRISPR repeat RNA endoribonuclease Cas6 [Thermogutta terrifontis]